MKQMILIRIQEAKDRFYINTGHKPTMLFLSIDLAYDLLIENILWVKFSADNKNTKNFILGMTIYRVIEPDVIVAC